LNSVECIEALSHCTELISAIPNNPNWWQENKLVAAVIAALLSTGFGAALTLIIQHLHQNRLSRSECARTLLEILKDFENQCVEYWSKDFSSSLSFTAEARIRATHTQLRNYSNTIDLGFSQDQKNSLNATVSKLFDEAMGGDFESKRRTASRPRIQRILLLTSRISPMIIEKRFR